MYLHIEINTADGIFFCELFVPRFYSVSPFLCVFLSQGAAELSEVNVGGPKKMMKTVAEYTIRIEKGMNANFFGP